MTGAGADIGGAPAGRGPASAAYVPARWVVLLRKGSIPFAVVLIGGSVLALALTGHLNLALLGVPMAAIAITLMHQLPRRLPPINFLGTRDLGKVEKETRILLVWAFAYVAATVAVVPLARAFPVTLVGEWSHSLILSVVWVLLAKVVLLGIPTILFAQRFGNTLRQLGLRGVSGRWRWVGPCAPILLISFGLLVLTGREAAGVPVQVLVALVGIAFVHAGFPEETFYRMLLQTRLELLAGTPSGIAASAILFGLRHIPSHYFFLWAGTTGTWYGDLGFTVAVVMSYQAVFGVLFGYMWMRYRNAWANMAGHTVFDVFAFLGLIHH